MSPDSERGRSGQKQTAGATGRSRRNRTDEGKADRAYSVIGDDYPLGVCSMTELSGVWSKDEIVAFFDRTTVPLRLACNTPSGRLWMVSLWYVFEDDTLRCATGANADIVGLLRNDSTVAFEISTNDPPYSGVRGNGTASVEPDPEKDLLRELLRRYLGGTDSRLARRLLSDDRTEVTIRIEPDRLHSWDFTQRMADAS